MNNEPQPLIVSERFFYAQTIHQTKDREEVFRFFWEEVRDTLLFLERYEHKLAPRLQAELEYLRQLQSYGILK